MPDSTPATSSAGKVLLLQGPVGPFFRTLARTFEAEGFHTVRVIFNFADSWFARWSTPPGSKLLYHRGSETDWTPWLRRLLDRERPDCIVLFGCERYRHVVAIKEAKERGIPVLSLEEGYVRPGFITAEWGGNNRRSPLRTASAAELAAFAERPVPAAGAGHRFSQLLFLGWRYYVLRVAGWPAYRHNVHHKSRNLAMEAFFWARNYARKLVWKWNNARITTRLTHPNHTPYVLVPFQVRDDMQLTRAGRGYSNRRLAKAVMNSFQRAAPDHLRLVFKVHPMERGHSNARRFLRRYARKRGILPRVDIVDDGPIGQLTEGSSGMVTVNSTSAFSAFHYTKPLAVLGEAVFRNPDLAFCAADEHDLDRFWTMTTTGSEEARRTFVRALTATALLPGDYYEPAAAKSAAAAIVDRVRERLRQDPCGEPDP